MDAGTRAPAAPAAAAAEAPRPESAGLRAAAEEHARHFFAALVLGDVRALSELSAYPFLLEGRRLTSADELATEWARHLRGKRTDLLTLYGIEVLTPAEMERRHGKPPARLEGLDLGRPATYVAVANLSGHPAVAVLREVGDGMRAVAFTD